MIALWKGKNPIYFGVIRSKVKVTVAINNFFYHLIIYRRVYFVMHTFLVPFVIINLEQNKTPVSICVAPDIKWISPGCR